MKRLFVTALYACLLNSLIPATVRGSSSEPSGSSNIVITVIPDTSGMSLPVRIDPVNLEIIPPSSGIQFYRDGIVFLSHSKVEDRMISDHVSFGTPETCYAPLNDTLLGEHKVLPSSEPFSVPSESMTFNSDYSVMYYAKRSKKDDTEKIYKAEYHQGRNGTGEWVSDKDPLNFCSDNSTYTHPALSKSGDMLVFSSDRRGSSGSLDLYVTHKVGESWSSPENLGKSVNTSGNELFPFLDKENNLYFSSDGYKGTGGYDLYVSKYNGKYWDKPVNLSKSINTQGDELALRIDPLTGSTAFFSVRDKSDSRAIRLYRITFKDPYSRNRYQDLSFAINSVAGIDVSPFRTPEKDTSLTAQAETKSQDNMEKPVVKQETGSQKLMTEKTGQPAKTNEKPQANKPVVPANETAKETVKPEPAKETVKKEADLKQAEANSALNKAGQSAQISSAGDDIVYRVQFFSSQKARGSYDFAVAGTNYKTFEYLYNGLYRSCVGEFKASAPAREFLKLVKQQGYADAFVIVFKNNQRSLDPALLK